MRTVAILLAAGGSERMGAPKALMDWHGRPLLNHQLDEIQRSRLSDCVVVLGRDNASLMPMVRPALRPGWKARGVVNPRPDEGKCSSIRAGLTALPAKPDAILIASVDQPLTGRLVDALLDAAEAEWAPARRGRRLEAAPGAEAAAAEHAIVLPTYGGRRGHPPLFRGTLFAELVGVREESEGLKAVIRRLPGRVLEMPWTSGDILMNLNTPDDLERVLRRPPAARP